jgi:hypothetical protein
MWGKAIQLCPRTSDVNLFGYREGIVNLDPEIPDSALDLSVAQEQLNGSQVARTAVDQRRLGSA